MKRFIQYVLQYKVPDLQVENWKTMHFDSEEKLIAKARKIADDPENTNVVAKKRVITQTDWEIIDYEE